MMKRTISLLLALLLCIGLLPTAALATEPAFPDVPKDAWYYNDVKTAVESGLINGKNGQYAPNDNMTYAEAVKLAACMHQKYTTGAVTLGNGNPWYQTYVDYAKNKQIIGRDYDWTQQVTRAGYMEIFAKALPDEAMAQVNSVRDGSIPDVPMTHVQAEAIYKLYRVGIVQGSDAAHNCKPGDGIKRSEVAAILTRMMDSSKRVTFSLGQPPKELTVTQEIPEEVAVSTGEAVTATVGVDGGDGSYTYQWQLRTASGSWTDISDADEATLNHTPTEAQLKAGLEYRCEITDGTGRKLHTRSLTPRKPADTTALTITAQPRDVTAAAGDSVSFTVAVSGGREPYLYRWFYALDSSVQHNAFVDLAAYKPDFTGFDSTSNTSTVSGRIDGTDIKNGFHVCVRVWDADGNSVLSEVATVIPDAPLTITAQPRNVTAAAGDTVSFSVAVSGGKGPYRYRWFYAPDSSVQHNAFIDLSAYKADFIGFDSTGDTSVVSGKIDGTDIKNGFHVCVRVWDADGNSVLSEVATMIPDAPLTITTHPQDVSCQVGETAVFRVAVKGGKAPYSYQWQFQKNSGSYLDLMRSNSTASGMGTPQLSIPISAAYANGDHASVYRCIITDAAGNSVTTRDVTVKLIDTTNGFRFYSQPQSVTIQSGGEAQFQVEIEGGQYPYSFQWQAYGGVWADVRHVANVGIETDEGYGISLLRTNDTSLADHPMRVIVTDKNGNQLVTEEFRFTVKADPLTITTQPQSVNCYAGETVSFKVAVSGGSPGYTYKWRFTTHSTKGVYADVMDSSGTTGQWTPQLTVKTNENHITSDTTFICIVKDQDGNTVESAVAKLNVSAPRSLSASISAGRVDYDRRPYTCNVSGGVGPYTYSWTSQRGTFLGSAQSCWVYQNDGTTQVICTVTDATGKSITKSHAVYF